MHQYHVSVAGNGRLSDSGKNMFHGRHHIETLDEYAMRKVDEEGSYECVLKFSGSECYQIVYKHTNTSPFSL